MAIIKVGPKERHVILLEGWIPITEGIIKSGDRFLLCPSYDKWLPVEEDDIGNDVSEYACIIRKLPSLGE